MAEMKKKKFTSSIAYGDGWTEEGLGAMARKNPEEFMRRADDLIEKGELTASKITSLRHLWNSLDGVQVKHTVLDALGSVRTITSNAFPILTGNLLVNEVNMGREAVPTIGQELVTESDDPKKWSHYAGILVTAPNQSGVAEMEPFPEVGASAERYDIGHLRNGFKMSITAEAIEENEWPQITMKCNKLGEITEEVIEEQTLYRVTDKNGSATTPAEPYVLRVNGGAASLYVTTNSTLTRLSSSGNRITNNALTDETDLEAALTRLASFTNERGKRIAIPMSRLVLLTPFALDATAAKILGSEYAPGVENELNNWGPRGSRRPRHLSSSKMDDLSTSAWYLGDFKSQFIRKWKLRYENASLGGNGTQLWLDQRIAAQFRLAWDVEIGAIGYTGVVQCLSGTTAP